MYTLSEFVVTADIDHLNIYKLLKFCTLSKICQKVSHNNYYRISTSAEIN